MCRCNIKSNYLWWFYTVLTRIKLWRVIQFYVKTQHKNATQISITHENILWAINCYRLPLTSIKKGYCFVPAEFFASHIYWPLSALDGRWITTAWSLNSFKISPLSLSLYTRTSVSAFSALQGITIALLAPSLDTWGGSNVHTGAKENIYC